MNKILNTSPIQSNSSYLAQFTRKTFKAGICSVTTFVGAELANNFYELYAVPYIYEKAQISGQQSSYFGTQWLAGHMAGQSAVTASRNTLEPASRVLGGSLGLLAGIIIADTLLFTADTTVNAITQLAKRCFSKTETDV
ncbi:MAG: hypothetical protein K2X08_07525 [Chlamydiales bacterium]|nr:hypothetical protein [Chlamydiales bacterium]